MTRPEFLTMLAEILEIESGPLGGDEDLTDYETWDSLAVVTVIAQIHVETGTTLDAKKVKASKNVADLLVLVEPILSAG